MKLIVQKAKKSWPTTLIIIVIISAFIFMYYPRHLTLVLGLNDISAENISNITIRGSIFSQTVDSEAPLQRESIVVQDITDKDFIKVVLQVLSHHTMRRVFFKPNTYYNPNPYEPGPIMLFLEVADKEEDVCVIISHNPKHVTITTDGNSTDYKLYGERIDTVKLIRAATNLGID